MSLSQIFQALTKPHELSALAVSVPVAGSLATLFGMAVTGQASVAFFGLGMSLAAIPITAISAFRYIALKREQTELLRQAARLLRRIPN